MIGQDTEELPNCEQCGSRNCGVYFYEPKAVLCYKCYETWYREKEKREQEQLPISFPPGSNIV